jgi:hypothetical protein
MMRKSPISYLVSAVFVLVAWAFSVLWGASYLGDSVSFQNHTPGDFQWLYRLVMTLLAVQSIVVISIWLAYGARDSTNLELLLAKRKWVGYWLLQAVLSIVGVVVIAILYLGELFEPMHYGVMMLTTALETWIVFWLATVLCSPPNVEFVPWGKR